MNDTVLIANRGEIAIRIARAAAELGLRSVAVHSIDETGALHVRKADAAQALGVAGARAYLDMDRVIAAAQAANCRYVHPGYGFLSEKAEFARRCEAAGLVFVGPTPETLDAFGDKAQARALALRCDVPVLDGTPALADAAEAIAFMQRVQGPVMLKAVAGGGGRGIRVVTRVEDMAEALERCRSEARAAFGNDAVYAEALLASARHIEIQVAGNGQGEVIALGDRECSLQRRNQKLVEFAPSPSLDAVVRARLSNAALRMAKAVNYRGIGTFEFLLDADKGDSFVFMEANPRLQVEHTVTEEVCGVDLVQLQLRLARGEPLRIIVPDTPVAMRGRAVQLRLNMETLRDDGTVLPASGTVAAFDLPSGPGVRVDTCGHVGLQASPDYDSLLAKLVVHTASDDHVALLRKARRALQETRIEGVATNMPLLFALLEDEAVQRNAVDTAYVERHMPQLLEASRRERTTLHALTAASAGPAGAARVETWTELPGTSAVPAPASGRLVRIDVREGEHVESGQTLAILESMKNEFLITSGGAGAVARVRVREGDSVLAETPLFDLALDEGEQQHGDSQSGAVAPDHIRDDLARVQAAHARLMDEARPDAVARRRNTQQRTARENIADLCDDGSFLEYGALAVAAQRSRRELAELERISPADGLVAGIGAINGDTFGAERSRCVVMSYDYTVFAGTQGFMAHEKKRRMLRLAAKWKLPLVLFAEGGGGRPGDTDNLGGLRLYNPTFWGFACLHAQVPTVAIASGMCFAGNAALLSVCDVVIATENASIGMGGPAMIEGGGLGVVAAQDVGPVATQSRNGVIDIVVRDEAAAVEAAKRYLSYFQGRAPRWECDDQRLLRHHIPEDPRQPYDMRKLIAALADRDSVLELRRHWGIGLITALVRIEGHPFALIANNPAHLSGALDADAAKKAAQFIDLAQAFRLPVLSLVDTPGFMVGTAAEAEGLVRHAGRMFIAGARVDVPTFTVVVRKAYGLGVVAMVGGNSHEQLSAVAWPTGHFGKMGLEGYVKLAYRKELEALPDEKARRARVEEMVAQMHESGSSLRFAPFLSIDDVIDPEQTRRWLTLGLLTARQRRGSDDPQSEDAAVRCEPQGLW